MRAVAAAFFASALALGACAVTPAQRAFDQRDYATAAKLADADVNARPGDEGAVVLRQRARDREVERGCAETEGLFASGRHGSGVGVLARVLVEVDRWGGPTTLSPAPRTVLARATDKAKAFLASLVGDASHPLGALSALEREVPGPLSGELSTARDEARAKARAAGQQRCTTMRGRATPDAPHLALVITRYCARFDGDGHLAPPSPTPTVDEAFVASHCARPTYSPEEAARCVTAGVSPAPAVAALAAAFDDDGPSLAAAAAP
jgi:hypothetical protein